VTERFQVVVAAGTLRSGDAAAIRLPHRWTAEGVSVRTEFTGAHLLHLAVAGCVLNDVYREAAARGMHLDGVEVGAAGGFDTDTWRSTGIEYTARVQSPASEAEIAALLDAVDAVAEIPRAVRSGAQVRRVG
jgi:uncharacterized OsmC-like protein